LAAVILRLAAVILRQVGHKDGQVGRQVRQSQNYANYDDGTIYSNLNIGLVSNLEHLLTIFLGNKILL
jgi:hypothetical protein